MQTRLYRVGLIIWNTVALSLLVTSQAYDVPNAIALGVITTIGNLVIVGWRQIGDGTTPTLPENK